MNETVRIDLHCHSTFSDGTLSPLEIARHCAQRDVQFASLTDHNTIEGLDAFEFHCERHGIGFISGVELSVFQGNKEIHLLCYGFDRTNDALPRMLAAIKESRTLNNSAYLVVHKKSAGELIEIIHQAGGIAILAHPLITEPDQGKLENLVKDLCASGLDGIEALYCQASIVQQEFLLELAERLGCVVSGGTDHHGLAGKAHQPMGIEAPISQWKAFRNRLIQQRRNTPRDTTPRQLSRHPSGSDKKIRMITPMVLPALAAIALFAVAMFGLFLPNFENALLERKRETIMELTSTVWSMLSETEKQVQASLLTPDAARGQAMERIRALRYGREGKDYFWLQDLSPKMIMHPYRVDLEGEDLADFTDPQGTYIFKVFADKVRRDGDGYVDYVWQWKDDPERMEAKESYIRLFEPWGWVIGTGLYINDVNAEIRALELRIYHAMLVVIGFLTLMFSVMLRSGLKSERLRLSAEKRLHESNARYVSLVYAAAEGVLFVRNQRCVYANPIFLELANCEADELELLNWREIFPSVEQQPPLLGGSGVEVYTDSLMHRRDGTVLKCRIALKGAPQSETGSFVVLVRRPEDVGRQSDSSSGGLLKRLLNLPSSAAEDIAKEIARSTAPEQVMEYCRRTPKLVNAMLESGTSPIAITRMISSITDSATVKFIEFAQADIGPQPVPFAFVAVGSQGRQEQTLYTDQDNIIIYNSGNTSADAKVEGYFSALASRVCGNLTQSGYHECKGFIMASNPKWCQPLDAWRTIFSTWISKAEGKETTDFVTFFDLRCVFGENEIVQAVRTHIQKEIAQAPLFFIQAARNAIQFKTPLRIFGNIVTSGHSPEKSGHLDIKSIMMPIVCFARLFALKRNLTCSETSERLSILCDQGMLLPSRYHDILTAFETLMRLRLRHQSEAIQNGNSPDNFINPSRLGHIDEAVLKECFREIDSIQESISKEFLGGEVQI